MVLREPVRCADAGLANRRTGDNPSGGAVVRLSLDGAEFWVSEDPEKSPESAALLGGDSVRIILTVADPDSLFARALAAGARQIFPVSEGHGWRVGRLADPFGLHWELGHPLAGT